MLCNWDGKLYGTVFNVQYDVITMDTMCVEFSWEVQLEEKVLQQLYCFCGMVAFTEIFPLGYCIIEWYCPNSVELWKKLIQKQGQPNFHGYFGSLQIQTNILVYLLVNWTIFVTKLFHSVEFIILCMFLLVLHEVCEEHEFCL